MRLMALASATTHTAVISGITPGVEHDEAGEGDLELVHGTPAKYRIEAASTWPAILAGADMDRKSSMRPTTKMAAEARSSPSISSLPWKKIRSGGMRAAAATATQPR